MMKRYLPLCVLILISFSCRHTNVGTQSDNVVALDFNTANRDLLADIIIDKKQIYLQTDAKESLLGEINKLVIKDSIIYILDYLNTRSLYTFNLRGEFLGKIGRRGRGPGEYAVWLMDFAIDNDGNVLLVDNTKRELHKYTSDGRYLKSIPLPFTLNGLVVLENSDYLLALTYPYEEAPQPQVILCDSLFNKKAEYLSFEQVGDKLDISPLLKVGGDIVYHREVNDTVYLFSARDGQLSKRFAVDFDDMRVPEKLRHDYASLGETKEYGYLYNTPLVVGKYMLGNMIYKDRKALFCFDTQENSSCMLPFQFAEIDLNMPNIPLSAVNDSTIVAYLDYATLTGAADAAHVDPKLVDHLENGGVVLELFTIKTTD